VTEPEPKPQRWSRWLQLVVTSPSGKMMFVCVVCGDVTPIPLLDCHAVPGGSTLLPIQRLSRDPRYVTTWPNALTCRELEAKINENIDKHTAERWDLDAVENKLRPLLQHTCVYCHGYGCQSCLGKGTRW
jgi:hypothetical protein